MRITRRSILAGGMVAAASRRRAHAALGGALAVPAQGALLQTITLVNMSGSSQAAGVPSNFIGLQFKKGDIPANTAPKFLISGASQPFSWGLQSYWSDGSLRTCSVVITPTVSIAGSGSQAVQVWSGGVDPINNRQFPARTLTEIYDQLAQVNVTIASQSAGTTGNFTAQFLNNANNLAAITYLDGDAGLFTRIVVNFVPANGSFVPTSSTPHGRLVCYGYIGALTNGNDGSLAGFTFLPYITQPWYNYSGSEAIGQRVFTTCQWQYGSGPTITNFAFPFSAKNFTWTSGGPFTTTTTHNFYQGSNDWNTIGCVLSSISGSTSPQVNTTTLYYINAQSGSNTQFWIDAHSNSTLGGSNIAPVGSGSATVTPVLVCGTFNGVAGAAANATVGPIHNYFQGATGSISARTTLRHKNDTAYMRSTKLIPPWASGLTISDWPTWTYGAAGSWSPTNIGPVYAQEQAAGQYAQIGWLSEMAARDYYNQTANSESVIRSISFGAANFSSCFRDINTRNVVNLSNTSYTGMPDPTTTLQWDGGGNGGFNFSPTPPASDNCFNYQDNVPSHGVDLCYWAYLRFGDPWMLDRAIDVANSAILSMSTIDRNPTQILPGYGLTLAWDQARTCGWRTRAVVAAAIIAPGTANGSALAPDGSKISQYFNDLVNANIARAVNTVTSAYFGSYLAANKYWAPVTQEYGPNPLIAVNANRWERVYCFGIGCLAAGALENADALTWVAGEATWMNHIFTTIFSSGYPECSYYEMMGTALSGHHWYPPITSDAQYSFWGLFSGVDWQTASPQFSSIPTQPYRVANGDVHYYLSDYSLPTGLSYDTAYIVSNASYDGTRCHWDYSNGTASGSGSAWFPMVHPNGALPANNVGDGARMDPARFIINYGFIKWAKALDPTFSVVPDISSLEADLVTRYGAGSGYDPDVGGSNGGPQWVTQDSF